MAVGLSEPIEAKLAADGVTEVIDTWLPAGEQRATIWLMSSVRDTSAAAPA